MPPRGWRFVTGYNDAVHDAASVPASAINNGGLDAQVFFLVEQLGVEEAERQIAQASGTHQADAEDDAPASVFAS